MLILYLISSLLYFSMPFVCKQRVTRGVHTEGRSGGWKRYIYWDPEWVMNRRLAADLLGIVQRRRRRRLILYIQWVNLIFPRRISGSPWPTTGLQLELSSRQTTGRGHDRMADGLFVRVREDGMLFSEYNFLISLMVSIQFLLRFIFPVYSYWNFFIYGFSSTTKYLWN